MKLQLARKLLAVLLFLLAIFIISNGINSAYNVGPGPADEEWFTANPTFAVFAVVSIFPFLGSYVLWPK